MDDDRARLQRLIERMSDEQVRCLLAFVSPEDEPMPSYEELKQDLLRNGLTVQCNGETVPNPALEALVNHPDSPSGADDAGELPNKPL